MTQKIAVCVESKEDLTTRFHFNVEKREFFVGEIFENHGAKFEVLDDNILITVVEL